MKKSLKKINHELSMPLLQIQNPKEIKQKPLAIGIDLGTTHSLVACDINGQIQVIPDDKGHVLLPSVVRYLPKGDVLVGNEAKAHFAQDPHNTIVSVKRLMGRSPSDVLALPHSLDYQFVDTKASFCELVTIAGKVNPIEVSAQILKKLMKQAHHIDKDIHEAVITVPAYFDDAQRQATKDAARIAGIKVLRLLNEPTAAAIAYGLDRHAQGNCLIFDLGGGTFDVSLLQLSQGVFQVLATGGDTACGGDDIDHLIAHWALNQLNLTNQDIHYSEVVVKARIAKEDLTLQSSSIITLKDKQCTLTVSILNELIAPLVNKTLAICQRVLKDAAVMISDIDHVVLVGGMTRTPFIREKVAQFFNQAPLTDIDPDKVVAIGAAVSASILSGHRVDNNMLLLDVVPLSLGIEMMGGVVEKILMRNTPIPATATQTFTTSVDGQNGLSLHLVQGERELAKDCRSLAHFDLSGFPAMPAGKARIDVTFRIDTDGLLEIEAMEASGVKSQICVKPSYGLTDEAVTALIESSITNAEEDIANRKLYERMTEANQLLMSLDKALETDSALLSSSKLEEIIQAKTALLQSLDSKDVKKINIALEALESKTQEFAELRLNTILSQALMGKSISDIENSLV